MLCSDGLYEPIGNEGIMAALFKPTAKEACETLITSAYEAGGRDNITAVVVRVSGAWNPAQGLI